MAQSLKLGTAQYSYLWNCSLDDSLREIKALGFKYIELMTAPPHLWPPGFSKQQRRDLRNLIDKLDLELVAINPTFLDINMASANPGIRKESVLQIQDQITLAHDLGARIIVVIIGKRHPLLAPSVEFVWREFAREGVLRCVEHAEKQKIIFGLENGPSLFIETAAAMRDILFEVDSQWMKAVFDAANAAMVEDVESGLETIKEDLIHVHLSDTHPGKWSHAPVGMGRIDFQRVADKLREIGFSGVSILETTYGENPMWGIESSVEKLSPLGWKK
jgi:sugar phosphate isomerase/epimerase